VTQAEAEEKPLARREDRERRAGSAKMGLVGEVFCNELREVDEVSDLVGSVQGDLESGRCSLLVEVRS
jgi:hypothetical protein